MRHPVMHVAYIDETLQVGPTLSPGSKSQAVWTTWDLRSWRKIDETMRVGEILRALPVSSMTFVFPLSHGIWKSYQHFQTFYTVLLPTMADYYV